MQNLEIYDDVFVDENICSGLDVDAQHRQNLHQLILGKQGISLNRRLSCLVSRVNQHSADLNKKERAIPPQELRGFSVTDFCALKNLPGIDERIDSVERALTAARDQEVIKATSEFGTIAIPDFDVDSIRRVLSTTLPDLHRAAEERVQSHLQTLGRRSEAWVADGMERMTRSSSEECPFCGQDISASELISHYRAYFSEAYSELKRNVTQLVDDVRRIHSTGAQVAFERAVGEARELVHFWSNYLDVGPIDIDNQSLVLDWNNAQNSVVEMLEAKQAAPLDKFELNQDTLSALRDFDIWRRTVTNVNERLKTYNESIAAIREQIDVKDANQLATELNTLKATKARFSPEIDVLCAEYLQEKVDKENTEAERDQVRADLNTYRETVFPALQASVNTYLTRFNAGFRIARLIYANLGGGAGSTCTYDLVINNVPVEVRREEHTDGEHDFRNSMSAGDRNTLALALFFSSLDQNSNLKNTTVVIDDPMSSLDEHRSLTTIQEIRKLVARAGQVIVLSHNKRFLCNLSVGFSHEDYTPLEIARKGSTSTIRTWDVSQDALTEHDRRYSILKHFADTGTDPSLEVAQAIRLHLEGYLRTVCPGDFPAGSLIGPFVAVCRQRMGTPEEILSKAVIQRLDEILQYANQFHHEPGSALQSSSINAQELHSFVSRTLDLVGPSRS